MWKYVRRNSPSVMPCRPRSSWHLHDVADRVVLDRAQRGGGDLAACELLARVEQLLRPQEAADVIGAERRAP